MEFTIHKVYMTPNQVKATMLQSLIEKEEAKLKRLLKEVIDTQNCIDSLQALLQTYDSSL